MQVSEFTNLFQAVRPLLMQMHTVQVLYKTDEADAAEPWRSLSVSLERNSSEADVFRSRETADFTRQYCDFLIERCQLPMEADGAPIWPTARSVIQYDGSYFRASVAGRETAYTPEDHEATVIRFRTTEQERVL